MNNQPIGIFDSGIGGVTVLDSCRKLMPAENYVYVSDPKNMPYGNKTEKEICARVDACVRELFLHGCKAIVAACNTATNVGICGLRETYPCKFVGLEPALKPAKEQCGDGRIVVLCTLATAKQPKFASLMQRYGGKNVVVLPQDSLAKAIEANIGEPNCLRKIAAELCQSVGATQGLVLGCTHYVFLRPYIEEFYKGTVKVFDGNDGAARRLLSLLSADSLLTERLATGSVEFVTL